MTPLDFERVREAGSESWSRADPVEALMETGPAWDRWLVTLPDGGPHEVQIHRDNGAVVGTCSHAETGEKCKARKYNDESKPCAHLCTIFKATLFNDPTVDGVPVQLFDADDAAIASADTHIEAAMAADRDAVATDGGPEVRQ